MRMYQCYIEGLHENRNIPSYGNYRFIGSFNDDHFLLITFPLLLCTYRHMSWPPQGFRTDKHASLGFLWEDGRIRLVTYPFVRLFG